ncbi:hypothetical protein GF339_18825, partial [candidate division KSB3 bacterium]|nr:hypothetical protein [candidate division KSB3 bacterium]MBD3326645.1 hypothetical protein [candidate division KSB3 bacterium]
MKRTLVISLLLGVMVLGAVAGASPASEFERKSQQLVAELHTYFPQVQGVVVSVQDDTVFLDLGLEHHLLPGAQLAVLQEGVEIIHPKTQEVLGTYEKQIATLQVTDVMEQFSIARILWRAPDAEIAQGSRVGAFSGRVKLAVLPVENLTETDLSPITAYTLFVRTLQADDRFTVFDEADLKAAALEADLDPAAIAQGTNLTALNAVLHADTFLRLELHPDAENLLTRVILLAENGQEIGSVQEIVRDAAALQQPPASVESPPDQPAETAPPVEPVATPAPTPQPPVAESLEPVPSLPITKNVLQEEAAAELPFWTSDILRIKANKLTVGDLTGDGENEVILSTRTDIEIFQHGILGVKDSFFSVGQIEGYNDALIIALGAADINQNGRAELFVTTFRNSNAQVRVFEYTDGKFEEIWERIGLILRVIHTPEGKTYLVGQKTTRSLSADLFVGNVSEYEWNGSEYDHKAPLNVPGRFDIFGFTLADLDHNGREEAIRYNRLDNIEVFKGRERIWRSRPSYEGYRLS